MKDMKRKKVLEKMASKPSVVIAITAGAQGDEPKKGWKCPECGYEHNAEEMPKMPKKEKKEDGKKAEEESEEY